MPLAMVATASDSGRPIARAARSNAAQVTAGAGAESRHEIGWVLVGGLTFGTVFTLFIVPAFYTLLSRRKPEVPVPAGAAMPAE